MRKFILFPCLLSIFITVQTTAQVTLINGNHILELSGSISTYYNQRWLKQGEIENDKNRFALRDAQFQFAGRIGNTWEYEFQADLADFISNTTGQPDAENPGLMEANVVYKGLNFVEVKMGYGKLPYSFQSMVPFAHSPYWQRAEIARGDFFSRRDVGVTLSKSLFKSKLNLDAGVYTGLGEKSLIGENDASGALEYIGRAMFCYPARYRKRIIDINHSVIPMFALAINGRYTKRNLPVGSTFPPGSAGEFGVKLIDGEKYVYGADATFQFKGFSVQVEAHQIKGVPNDTTSSLLLGTPQSFNKGFFLAGAFVTQASYYLKQARTIFSFRFENLNINDLIDGYTERYSAACAYKFKKSDAMLKMQYYFFGKEEIQADIKFKQQLRVGYQINF
jgi:hypothetical protein